MEATLTTASDAKVPASLKPITALVFDVIGTCTDWHTIVSETIRKHSQSTSSGSSSQTPPSVEGEWASMFAHHWRAAFFALIPDLAAKGQMISGEEVYRRTLRQVMEKFSVTGWNEEVQQELLGSWKLAKGWKDSATGLHMLRKKYVLISLTNGTTLTTIGTHRRNDFPFDAILCSDVLGAYKPDPKMYQAAITAVGFNSAMVAAHAYDLDAARTHGMKTIYVRRTTEDTDISDEEITTKGYDMVVNEGGLIEVARRLGCDE